MRSREYLNFAGFKAGYGSQAGKRSRFRPARSAALAHFCEPVLGDYRVSPSLELCYYPLDYAAVARSNGGGVIPNMPQTVRRNIFQDSENPMHCYQMRTA